MKNQETIEEFAKYWESFKEAIEAKTDVIFEQLWKEAHPNE